MSKEKIHINANYEELNEREQYILRKIVQLYILKASPIGSRFLAKNLEEEIKLSPATLRNVMSDLEEQKFISHPHTSAGRIPTDKGYRFYVDSLDQISEGKTFNKNFTKLIKKELKGNYSDKQLKEASKLLGMLSRYLGFVQFPQVNELIVEKIELVAISTKRVLVVIALDSNVIRTVTLEAEFDINQKQIPDLNSRINELISGKPLKFLRENFYEMVSESRLRDVPLIRLFTDSLDKIFEQEKGEKLAIAGSKNLLDYPEFEDLSRVRSVIELVENEDIIIHLLSQHDEKEGLQVLIGKELGSDLFEDYSFVKASYSIGSAAGSIGLIGPKRMNYSEMIYLVQSVSEFLSKK